MGYEMAKIWLNEAYEVVPDVLIASHEDSGKRKILAQKNNSTVGKKESYADMFGVPEGTKIGFAVFNGGGKIDFTDFKFFFAGDAKNPEE